MEEEGPGSEMNEGEWKACIEKTDALIKQYSTRRKEIEDSFIACGLEVPLVSRDLNATVSAVGPSFEPVGRDYRVKVEEEYRSAPASEPQPVESAGDDLGPLEKNLRDLNARIASIEQGITEASLDGDDDRRRMLEKEGSELRALRDRTVAAVREERSQKSPQATDELLERMDRLEGENRGLRAQISILRDDLATLMTQMDEVLQKLGLDVEEEESY